MGVTAAGSIPEKFRRLIVANISPRAVAPILEVLVEWDILDLESLSMLFHIGENSPREAAQALLAGTRYFNRVEESPSHEILTLTSEALVTLKNLSRANLGPRAHNAVTGAAQHPHTFTPHTIPFHSFPPRPPTGIATALPKPSGRYIRRDIYTGETRGRPPAPKRAKPLISATDARADPFAVACMFSSHSSLFRCCSSAAFTPDMVRQFVLRAITDRCRTANSQRKYSAFMLEYIDFTNKHQPPLPQVGDEALVSITLWLDTLLTRGFSVPSHGKYALKVFSEALGIPFPIHHPTVVRAARAKRTKALRQAPMMPLELILKLECTAVSNANPSGLRLYCSLFCLMTFASLRFSDLRQVTDLWASDTAICGLSVNQKDKNGDLIQWATPREGLTKTMFWAAPLLRFWKKHKPSKQGRVIFIFPYVSNDWTIDPNRAATNGTAQAALNRIITHFGLTMKVTLHSPRNWAATCAHQLKYPREERETIGHWAPGSLMPDRYDRAVCSTELRIRNDIFSRIRDEGWQPTPAFEIPGGKKGAATKTAENKHETSTAASTSETSLTRYAEEEQERIDNDISAL